MFGIFKKLLKNIRAPKRIPMKGELWTHKQAGPWPSTLPPVTIVDVKAGYVRYDMTVFKDNRNTIEIFLNMYEPHEKN